MKTHTSSFKEQIKLMGKEIDSRITFGSTVLGKDDLNAVTPSYQGAILKSVMKQLDIDSNVEIPIGTILKYEFGLKVNGEYEYINYGNYVVYSIEKQEDTNSYKITCYDKLLYSMLDYVKLPITYPISIRDYINAISTALGLKFANKSGTFANYDKQIQADLYDGLGYTFRDILDELAQVTASTICLNNNDELEIRYITETSDTIDEEFLKDVNVNFGEKFGKVNTIVLSRSAGSDNIYYPTVLPTNPYEIKISDNQIMNGNDRADFLPDIYNKLNGLEFYTNDFVSTGIIYYDLCDRYSVKVGDNTYSCVMFNDEVLVTQGLEENVYTELPEQTKTDYKKADTTDRRINQAYAILDKQNKKFEVLVSEVDSNGEKIGSLEITTGNISTKVSSVEKNLTTTNTNLSNLSGKVDTLSNDINGVSADFEDFKDNEYIQSIDNLQKQIDGAIQFWNGAEIPTINNYPANQWTTENDRINHQADIYTVIQDVEGEMKQGKSYRFDKVNGVWKWIELTDNELSAVQALAQEALEKANKNATEIGTVKTRVSSLEQTDEQIKASVESIDKQIIPTASVSGSNIYVEDASDNPLTYLEIEGKSTQETRSGKNKAKINDFSVKIKGITITCEDGVITFNGTATADIYRGDIVNYIGKFDLPEETYTFSTTYVSGGRTNASSFTKTITNSNTGSVIFTNNDSANTQTQSISENKGCYVGFSTSAGSIFNNYKIKLQLEKGTTSTDWEQYGVSPSPDYPSEIESVGYENLFDINSITENYLYEDGGIFTPATTYNTSDYISCKSNEFIVSAKFTAYNPYIRYIIAEFDENKTYIQRQLNTDSSSPKYTFTLNDNTKYIRLCYRNDATLYDIQLGKGSIAHPYISYGKYGIEVKTVGENLLESIKPTGTTTANGLNFVVNDDKTILVNGISTQQTAFLVSEFLYNNYGGKYVKGAPSGSSSSGYCLLVSYYDENSKWKADVYDKGNGVLINGDYPFIQIAILIRNGITVNNQIFKPMIVDNIDTEYKPYQKNASVIVLDAPLRSLPNGVEDIAYIKNNKLYVDRKVGSLILNGSEKWHPIKMVNVYGYYVEVNGAKKVTEATASSKNILCNYYKATKPTWQWNSEIDSKSCAINTGSTTAIRFTNGETTNELATFKNWLSTHNVQVDYELVTPITEEIGEIKMLSTFKGINHISTTDKLEPIINLTYVRDTVIADYVENHVTELKLTENEIKASVKETNKKLTDLENIEEEHYSELVLKSDQISSTVSKKIGSDEVVSSINQSAEQIELKGNRVVIESDNFDLTADGEITATAGQIAGFSINKNGFTYLLKPKKDYTQTDIDKLSAYIYQGGSLTDSEKQLYDANNDGVLNLQDIQMMSWTIVNNISNTLPGKFQIGIPKVGDNPYIIDFGLYNGFGELLNGFTYNKATFVDTEINGNLTVTGSKNRIVNIGDKSVLLNAYETTIPYFGDIGSNITDENGYCKIEIEEIFSKTIESDDYKVFIQKCGQGDLYVIKHKKYFEVKGTPNLDFDWEIKAIQKGFKNIRLQEKER